MADLTGDFTKDFGGTATREPEKKAGLTGDFDKDFGGGGGGGTESAPTPIKQKSPSSFEMGLQAAGDVGVNLVHGINKGAEDVGNALFGAALETPPPNGGKLLDLTSNVNDQMGQQIQRGQQQHPILSGAAEGLGESVPTLPAWETGAGAAGGALKMAKPALEASGPVGASMLNLLTKSPQAAEVLHTFATQGTGGFLSGMQEEMTKEMSKGGNQGKQPLNPLKILQAGMERGMEGGAGAGALHAVGEMAIKSAGKLKMMAQEFQAKQEIKRLEQQQKHEFDQAKAQHDLEQQTQEAERTKVAREQAHADERKEAARQRFEAHQEQQREATKRMWKAQDEVAALRKEKGLNDRAEKISQAEERARAAKQQADFYQHQADESAKAHQEELQRWEGSQAATGAQSKISQAEERARAGAGGGVKQETTIPAPKHVNPDVERQALSFINKHPLKDEGTPPVVAPAATTKDLAPASMTRRSNKTRAEYDPETGDLQEEQEPEGAYNKYGEPGSETEEAAIRYFGSKNMTILGMNGAEAAQWLDKFRHEVGDVAMHAIGMCQKISDIFGQYDNDLAAEALKTGLKLEAPLKEMFSQARSKVKVQLMKAGEMGEGIWAKGLRGNLTKEERAALPADTLKSIDTARDAIKGYIEKIDPLIEWLDKNYSPPQGEGRIAGAKQWFHDNSGFGRLRQTLKLQKQELMDLPGGQKSNSEKNVLGLTDLITRATLAGKAGVSVIHAVEKGLVLAAKEGFGLGRAIKDAYLMPETAQFSQDFLEGSTGPITEAFEDLGVKVKSGVGKVLTGKHIEASPNRVATAMGLHKAAKELGYESAEALAADLNAARNGTGSLAHDTAKVERAIQITQDYVSDLTGINVPGFKDSNIFQRGGNSPALRLGNLFLTAQLTQTRNGWNIGKALLSSDSMGALAKNSATAGGYLFGLYLAAGDKAPFQKEGDLAVKAALGAPGYYRLMDSVHGARALMRIDQLPTIPHLAPSINPLATSTGASGLQILRDTIRGAMAQKGEDAPFKIAKAVGLTLGGTIMGVGTGTLTEYAKAERDAERGFKMHHVYGTGALGGEEHVADIPIETNRLEALGSQYFRTESAKESGLTYNAQKTFDLRSWVKQNAPDEDFWKESKASEADLDAVSAIHDIRQEKNETLADLKDAGYKPDSPEIQEVTKHYTKLEAEGDKGIEYWHQRAVFWQMRADEIRHLQEQQALSGSKPQA